MDSQPEAGFVRDGIDLRLLARRQRWILWLVLGSVASIVLPFGAAAVSQVSGMPEIIGFIFVALNVVLRIAIIIGTVQLMRALRTHILLVILLLLFLLVPLINLIVLLVENVRATRVLKRAGVPVGLMGATDEDVVRLLGPHLCRRCGYDLTANVSGYCPECGMTIPTAEKSLPSPLPTPPQIQ